MALATLLLALPSFAQDGSGQAAPVAEPPIAEPAAPVDLSGVEVSLEPAGPYTTAVGLPFDLAVSIRVPAGLELVSVSVGGNPYIELTESSAVVEEGGIASQSLRLSVFRSGAFTSSGIEALIIDQNGEQHRISSVPFVVDVESRIVNENDPAPAPSDPPLTVFSRDMRPIYAGSAFGFLGLGALIAALWRRRNRVEEVAEDEAFVRRPAWEIAFEALDALEAEGMLDDGRHLEFHMRLSEILREYIGARFSFLALEMTTTEIARALSDRETGEYREELLEVLGDMDLVKFAKFTPPRDLSDGCFDSVKRVVNELSARERQAEVEIEPEAPAQPGAANPASVADPHAPSPESTTVSFAESEATPENVVEFPGNPPGSDSLAEAIWGEPTKGDE